MMTDFQMCLHSKWYKKKGTIALTTLHIYLENITFVYKKVQM